jgi:hypothetical protein
MSTAAQLDAILFENPSLSLYAILDGACIPDLLDQFDSLRPEHVCLYRGELKDGIDEVAPYLVRLEPGHPFTHWLTANGWGAHYGIYIHSADNLGALRLHLRRSLRVYTEDGRALLFRYYDPRVFRVFIPSMTPPEAATFFGPIQAFLCEDEDPASILRFSLNAGKTRREIRALDSTGGWPAVTG